MNFSLAAVLIIGVGTLFIYSALKDTNPAQVIKDALAKGSITSKTGSALGAIDPTTKPGPTTGTTPAPRTPIVNMATN
jgi:hypothetical protein